MLGSLAATLCVICLMPGLFGDYAARRLLRPKARVGPGDAPNTTQGRKLKVTIQAARGLRLKGWLLIPPRPKRRLVVFAHRWGGRLADRRLLLDSLLEAGFHVLAYHQRGHGASGGKGSTWGRYEGADLRNAISTVMGRRRARFGPRVAVIGEGMGATAALVAARHDNRIAAVMALSPTLNQRMSLLRGMVDHRIPAPLGRLVLGRVERFGDFRFSSIRLADAVKRLRIPALLLVVGDRPGDGGSRDGKAVFKVKPGLKELLVVKGAGRWGLLGKGHKQERARALTFLKVQLGLQAAKTTRISPVLRFRVMKVRRGGSTVRATGKRLPTPVPRVRKDR